MAQKLHPVDVISVCSASGEIRPLRIRVEDEIHGSLRVDIEDIISTREIPYVGIESTIFLCRATVYQKRWLFELKYSVRTHSWQLIRKLY